MGGEIRGGEDPKRDLNRMLLPFPSIPSEDGDWLFLFSKKAQEEFGNEAIPSLKPHLREKSSVASLGLQNILPHFCKDSPR